MGIISCFPGGGGGVQPDWNQNDSTQPDYIKNRPFYTGDPVETILVEESTVSFAEDRGLYVAQIQSSFAATVGETYKVYWDGAAYECACVNVNGILIIGNLSITGEGSDTGEPFVVAILNGNGIQIVTADTSASHTVSISATAVVVVKIDEKYLPDTIATKSEVEVTQAVLDGVFSSVVTFTFDKQTSGRDTFNFNGFNYYKISDFNPAPDDVISFEGTNELGAERSGSHAGNNCVVYGGPFIVVASAGACSVAISETTTKSFTAPSAGLYARYTEGNQQMTAGTGEFTLRGSTGSFPITDLLLKSSTAGSTKKFKITVNDSGTLTITNEQEGTSSICATPSDISTAVSDHDSNASAHSEQFDKKQNVPTQLTALPDSGTALTANTLYNVSAAVGTYSFTAPATGWAHGIFTTGTTPNITFTGKIIGKLPDFAASKQYEFDVYNGAWIVQEVVTQ